MTCNSSCVNFSDYIDSSEQYVILNMMTKLWVMEWTSQALPTIRLANFEGIVARAGSTCNLASCDASYVRRQMGYQNYALNGRTIADRR